MWVNRLASQAYLICMDWAKILGYIWPGVCSHGYLYVEYPWHGPGLRIFADQKEFEGLSKMRFINVILWWKVRPMQRGCASDLLWHRDLYWQHNHEFICREGWRCDSWLAKFFILTHDSHQYVECWARIWTDAVFPGANLPIESRTTNWVLQTRCKLFMKNMFTLKVLPGTHFINGQFFSLRDSSPDRIFSHIYHFFPIGSTL